MQKVIFPGGTEWPACSSLLLSLCSGWVWLRGREYFLPCSPHLLDGCSASGMTLLRILGPNHPWSISRGGHFKTKRGKLKNLEVLPSHTSSTQLLKTGCHTGKRMSLPLSSPLESWLRDFIQGEKQALEQRALNPFPRTDFTSNRVWREVQA